MARRRRKPVEEAISPHWAPSTASRPVASAPAPSAPAPQYTAPDIRDATYNDTINTAWRNLGDFTAYTAGQQGLLRSQFGYLDDQFTVDPNNPFGQAQLLKRAYDQNVAGTRNSYAARGQQTSGAYGRQQGANLFNYQQSNNALQTQFAQANGALLQALADRTSGYYDRASEAAASALDRSIAGRTPGVTSAGPRPLGANERVATSPQDGQKYVYRLKDGKWLRVRRA